MPPTFEDLLRKNANVVLSHVYDPAKARQYYLRTRQLKGRKTGTAPEPTSNNRSVALKSKVAVPPVTPKPVFNKSKDPMARVAEIKSRLNQLLELLQGVDVKEDEEGDLKIEAKKPGAKFKAAKRNT